MLLKKSLWKWRSILSKMHCVPYRKKNMIWLIQFSFQELKQKKLMQRRMDIRNQRFTIESSRYWTSWKNFSKNFSIFFWNLWQWKVERINLKDLWKQNTHSSSTLPTLYLRGVNKPSSKGAPRSPFTEGAIKRYFEWSRITTDRGRWQTWGIMILQ